MSKTIWLWLILVISAYADPPAGYIQDFDSNFNVPNWPGILDWNTLAAYNLNNWQLPRFVSQQPDDRGNAGVAFYIDGQGDDPSGQPSPFWTGWGHLYINAWWAINRWNTGMISTVDTYGNGFSAIGGYWEAQIQVPASGPALSGMWPAFWLYDLDTIQRSARTANAVEVDIFEGYGVAPNGDNELIHLWTPSNQDVYGKPYNTFQLPNGMNQLHVYGCLINPDYIHFLVDGSEVWKTPTPTECLTHPLYAMIDFAMQWDLPAGSGTQTMAVQYLKHWSAPSLPTYNKWQAGLTTEEGKYPSVPQLQSWLGSNPPFSD
jgi:Glycosyl hydrolases family 16